MTAVIVSGGIDLSVGSVLALSATLTGDGGSAPPSRFESVSRGGWIDGGAEARAVRRLTAETGLRAASPSVAMATLSGGNQQKAVLARCLFAGPKVLLLDEPTRGIDLAAKAEIYALLRRLSSEGFGILLCSSEMSEIPTARITLKNARAAAPEGGNPPPTVASK